jgi:hypothetical protein
MSGSSPIRESDRYLDESGQMVMRGISDIDEVFLYQCSNCQEWFTAGDTYVTGGGTEYCYNEPCRELQEQ